MITRGKFRYLRKVVRRAAEREYSEKHHELRMRQLCRKLRAGRYDW